MSSLGGLILVGGLVTRTNYIRGYIIYPYLDLCVELSRLEALEQQTFASWDSFP